MVFSRPVYCLMRNGRQLESILVRVEIGVVLQIKEQGAVEVGHAMIICEAGARPIVPIFDYVNHLALFFFTDPRKDRQEDSREERNDAAAD